MSRCSALAKAAETGIVVPAAAPDWPTLPPWLRRHAEILLDPDAERRALVAGSLATLRDSDRAIAARAADIVDGWLVPAGRDVIARWLQPIGASVERRSVPDSAEAMQAFIAAVAMLGIPEKCFTLEAQRRALRSWTWWPSAERVAEVVEPPAIRLRRIRDTLRRMAEAAPPPAAPREVLTAEHRAAVIERFHVRWAAEVAGPVDAQRAATKPAPVRPAPLSDGVLLERYRAIAEGGGPTAHAAAFRVAAIEARMRPAAD